MKKKSNSKFTEDYIPVESITNGSILLTTGEKVTGVKVIPRNIFILDQNSQDSIIYNFKNVYNAIDYEFWIIVADRPVDINVYISQLNLLYNSNQNQKTRKMIMEDIDKANMFVNNNIVDTEFYLLFKEKNNEIISKRIRSLISNFASAGLSTQQVSNDDLRVVLDNFLNGGQNTSFGTVVS